MSLSRIGMAAGILAMLAWIGTPAFAGHDPSMHGHGHKGGMFGDSHGKHGGNGHGNGKHGDKGYGHNHGSFENTHSNKGGAERGLDRANEAAGYNGEEGRENASAHHNSHGSHHGDE
jgi:hypothetical protein